MGTACSSAPTASSARLCTMNSSHGGSPYITNFDLVPPSPSHSHNDLPPDLTSPPFHQPHTPSYNGSYYNSPFSQHSELSFSADDLNYDLLHEMANMNEYEPSDYDPANAGVHAGGGLLMFSGDGDYTTATLDVSSPPLNSAFSSDIQHRAGSSPFDHSSPSDNGDDPSSGFDPTGSSFTNPYSPDATGNGGGRHSRASSVASHSPSPGPNQQFRPSPSPQPSPHLSSFQPQSLQPQPQPSPRMAVAQQFGSMSVHTPNWGTAPLPQITQAQAPGQGQGEQQKAPSPPRLRISDEGTTTEYQHPDLPKINAPDDQNDMNMGGPQFHIVPATPVSGGVGERIPFQQTLSTLTQGSELGGSISQEDLRQNHQQQLHSLPPSQGASPYPSRPASTNPQQQQQQLQQTQPQTQTVGGFVFPDTQTMPGQLQPTDSDDRAGRPSEAWGSSFGLAAGPYSDYEQQQERVRIQQAQQVLAAQQTQQQHRQHLQNFTFGGSPQVRPRQPQQAPQQGGYLSPDMMQRSVSDSGRGGHRHSRSEDVRNGVGMSNQMGPGGNGLGGYAHHGQSASIGGLSAYSNPNNANGGGFLHPLHLPSLSMGSMPGNTGAGALPSIRQTLAPGMVPGHGQGHFTRPSSGSRSDRGADVWGSGGGGGVVSHLVPRRVSPYPSPNASPRVRYGELDDADPNANALRMTGGLGAGTNYGLGVGISGAAANGAALGGLGLSGIGEPPVSAGYDEEVGITGRGPYGGGLDRGDAGSSHSAQGGRRRAGSVASGQGDGGLGSQIAKQNVTTGRTANASIRRRKQDANFACTVPGCNSTFTRGFNLKGHLRSHYEQKPYKCHWPGCGKGFARQHDCKRHEQLHSNFRPFECEGCRKQFARMDALNRHLRSEAGAECARIVEGSRGADALAAMTASQDISPEMDVGGMGGMDGGDEYEDLQVKTRRAPRRRNTGGGGLQADEWGVAL